MTPHNEAQLGEIAKTVIMPGDPLRAKFIAENYLENAKLVNTVRNMFAYTGTYKGNEVTVMASGMGIPSMGIYSYELFKFYDVDKIIRIGTSGSMNKDVHVLDVVMATSSYSLSNFPYLFDGVNTNEVEASINLNNKIREVSVERNISLKEGRIVTSDVFDVYIDDIERYENLYPSDLNALACEMESFVLFYMAQRFNKEATCLVTIVDSKFEDVEISSSVREKSLDNMIVLALDAITKI